MSETVMGIWTSLVRLSGTGGRGAAAAMAALPALPSSAASNVQSLTPTKPIQRISRFPSDGEHEDTLYIRYCIFHSIFIGFIFSYTLSV